MKMFRFLFLTLFPVVSGIHDISDECMESDDFLMYNTTYVNESNALYESFIGDDVTCDDNGFCTFDYTPMQDDYEKICTKFGAVMSVYSYEIDCVVYNITGAWLNLPYCFGGDCTESEIEEIFLEDIIDASWYEQFDDCTFSYDSAAPSLGQSSLLVSVAMSGLWWLYNL